MKTKFRPVEGDEPLLRYEIERDPLGVVVDGVVRWTGRWKISTWAVRGGKDVFTVEYGPQHILPAQSVDAAETPRRPWWKRLTHHPRAVA